MFVQFQGIGISKRIGRFKSALYAASNIEFNSKASALSAPYKFHASYEIEPSKATKSSAINAIL